MKIQMVTNNIIQTYNPTEDYKIGITANKIPGNGYSSLIAIETVCKDTDPSPEDTLCLLKRLKATREFTSFITSMLKK